MKAENRKATAKEIEDSGVNNGYYHKVTDMKNKAVDAGNITACST